MADLEQEELISAYIDDELSPDERLRVEQWLASDPQARQLLEDLRALRGRIQSLPVVSPPAGFTQRVLADLDRNTVARAKGGSPAAFDDASAKKRWFGPGGRSWRPLSWASLATAAALLIAFLGRQSEREVELAPQAAPKADALRLRPLPDSASEIIPEPHANPGLSAQGTSNDARNESEYFFAPAPPAAQLGIRAKLGDPSGGVLVVRGRVGEAQAGVKYLQDVLRNHEVAFIADQNESGRPGGVEVEKRPITLIVQGSKSQLQGVLEQLSSPNSPVHLVDVSTASKPGFGAEPADAPLAAAGDTSDTPSGDHMRRRSGNATETSREHVAAADDQQPNEDATLQALILLESDEQEN
jgi:negative regulator of sigma E activity